MPYYILKSMNYTNDTGIYYTKNIANISSYDPNYVKMINIIILKYEYTKP